MTYLEPGLEQAVADFVGANPGVSGREVARKFGISPTTAMGIIRKTEKGELRPRGDVEARLAVLEEEVEGMKDYVLRLATRIRDTANALARHASVEEWERKEEVS